MYLCVQFDININITYTHRNIFIRHGPVKPFFSDISQEPRSESLLRASRLDPRWLLSVECAATGENERDGGLHLRLPGRRIRLRRQRRGHAPGPEGLFGRRRRGREALARRRFRPAQLEPAQIPLAPLARPLRDLAPAPPQRRLHPGRVGRRRRQPQLRQHALRPARHFLRAAERAAPGRPGRAPSLLRSRRPHARRRHQSGRDRPGRPDEGDRGRDRARRDVPTDAGRRLFRAGGRARRGPLLRGRRAGPRRL